MTARPAIAAVGAGPWCWSPPATAAQSGQGVPGLGRRRRGRVVADRRAGWRWSPSWLAVGDLPAPLAAWTEPASSNWPDRRQWSWPSLLAMARGAECSWQPLGRAGDPPPGSAGGEQRPWTPVRDGQAGWGRAGGDAGGGLRSPPRRRPPAPPRSPARSCRDLDACPCTPNTATTPFRRHRPLPSGRRCLFGLTGRLVFGAALRVVA